MNPGQPAPGWWLASDGNWYAPELHPSNPVDVETQPPVLTPNLPSFGSVESFASGPSPYLGARTATLTAPTQQDETFIGAPPGATTPKRNRIKPGWIVLVVAIAVVVALVVGKEVTHKTTASSGSSPAASTSQDVATQDTVRDALTYVLGEYESNHASFTGVTPAAMEQDPHAYHHLMWIAGPTTPSDGSTVSLAADDQAATVAALAPSGTCWFAHIDMNTGSNPRAPEFVGQRGGPCNALAAPSTGWAAFFPPPQA